MIFGFSKPWNPAFIHFYSNKMLPKIQGNCGNILGKYYVSKYGHQKLRKKSKVYVPCFFEDIISKLYSSKMRIGNDKFSIKDISKSLDMNCIYIKKHEMEMRRSYFQVRESPKFFIFKEGNNSILISR